MLQAEEGCNGTLTLFSDIEQNDGQKAGEGLEIQVLWIVTRPRVYSCELILFSTSAEIKINLQLKKNQNQKYSMLT